MTFLITQTSHFALNIVRTHGNGLVHSVYRKTINLILNGQLIALQAADSPLSPISLITELTAGQMENLKIEAGDTVQFTRNQITIVGKNFTYFFLYSQAILHNTQLIPVMKPNAVHYLEDSIRTVIADTNTNGFDLIFNNKITEDSPLPLLVAKKRIERSKNLYNESNFIASAEELSKLIGLGSGLTPSGDDFLCGLLAAIILTNSHPHEFSYHLHSCIQEHLTNTIDISAAFLACALEKEFSLAVNNLTTLPSCNEIKANFLAIGHSSGIDTLCGLLFGLELLISQ